MGKSHKLPLLKPFRPLDQKPRSLTKAEVEHGIRITLIEGVLATAFGLLVGGTFFNALVIKMGADTHSLGLIASLGPLSTLIQLIVPWLRERVYSRRRLLFWLVVPGRLLAWGVIFIPVLLPRAWWMPVLLAMTFIRSLLGQLDNITYQDWLADLIPIERRSSYWGLRHTLSGPVGIIIPFLAGWILDRWGGFTGFQILYLIALPLMIADILLFLYQDEPPWRAGNRFSLQSQLNTLKLKPFHNYLLFFGLWNLLQGAMTPYTSYLMFKVYHLPYTFISGITVLSTVISTLLYVAWGRVFDRIGVRRVYCLVLPLIALVTGLWGFVDSSSYGLYLILFALTGAVNAATMVGSFNLLMSVLPTADRFVFLSMNSIIMGIAGFLAPNIGAYFIDLLSHIRLPLSAFHTSPIQQLFIFGSLGSLFLALAFGKFVQPLPDSGVKG